MLVMGMLLGFVGAGGSGFIIAILTVVFDVPIHTALGTSLAAMMFTTMSGAISHFREGNISVKTGLIVGGFGAVASYLGSRIAGWIPANSLHWLTSGALFLAAVLLVIRLFLLQKMIAKKTNKKTSNKHYILLAATVGIITGMITGTVGIGAAPYIQLGLIAMLGLSIKQSVGTGMLVILPSALAGGIGYYFNGYLDFVLLAQVLAGTMIGSYIGAVYKSCSTKCVKKCDGFNSDYSGEYFINKVTRKKSKAVESRQPGLYFWGFVISGFSFFSFKSKYALKTSLAISKLTCVLSVVDHGTTTETATSGLSYGA
jgi:uncharacterized membrane protein YfcA